MTDQAVTNEKLLELLQDKYFAGVDGGDADAAVEAMHEDVIWAHTQVWVHDGHDRSKPDVLHGREEVRQFLADRIGQMQVVGIKHKVRHVVTDGKSGAFRAEVVGPSGESKAFFGWVEISDGKISNYEVGPILMGGDG